MGLNAKLSRPVPPICTDENGRPVRIPKIRAGPLPESSPTALALKGWGHSIAAMDARLRDALTSRIVGLEYEEVLRRMLCTVGQDDVWLHVAEALEAYAVKGRFFHLDVLAGEVPDPGHDPTARWESAERAALDADPSLGALQDQASWEGFEAALLGRVADSIRRWWGMIGLMGMHGVLGTEGESFGADVLPDGAVPFGFSESC